jgi:hypothetical protein
MRAALDRGEKGLNFMVTSVKKRGIIVNYGLRLMQRTQW